ncbi:class I SAM-dependent methyltransferase [Enterococcus saccharolyticus]|uniref:class I SAM-dependent methyltransferase n=1 Tax=Enterococcus saccharolyticus TaxID=41997 RepID=UPI001E5643F4|nr:class I SAM-dependent methyltransferase [Enterococcus saccharolyticus]MCD5003434.1 class I SAM-dependent methyltransferase [Enterococcus saccharolyticus]
MFPEKIEESFHLHLEAIQLLQNALNSSYLDTYVENVENVIDQFQVRVIDGVPSEQVTEQVNALYQRLKNISLEQEEIRKLSQLLLLKGSQTEPLQPNHQLTPDSIGFLFVFLIEQLTNKEQPLSVLDISVGMGNLLLTIISNLSLANYQVTGVGVDNDETLLAVAAANSQWMNADIQLFHQDGLQSLLIDPMDIVVSDLPVGYYPIDEKAQEFVSASPEGHSFAHHLLMEQSMNYVKEDGFGLFLVPSNFLETEQSQYLKQWLSESVYLQGIIQLPDDLFKNEASRKSILILQRRGSQATQVSEVLLAKLTSLKEPKYVTAFFQEFVAWKTKNGFAK